MKCPNCAALSPEGTPQCGQCGLDFAKWERRERERAAAPAPAASSGRDGLGILAVVVLLAAGAVWKGWSYLQRDKAERDRLAAVRESLKPADAAPAAPPPPSGPPPEAYKGLDAVAEELNAQWQSVRDPRTPQELRGAFAAGWSGLDHDGQRFKFGADPKAVGIMLPPAEPVTAADGANGVKCLKNGQTVYEMGPGDEGYGPCWRRNRVGSEVQGDFLVIFMGEGKLGNDWLPQRWHRALRIWTPYTEEEVLRLYAWHAEQTFGPAAQAASAQRAYKLLSDPAAKDEVSRAVHETYMHRARYEGAMARLEAERKRLP